MSYNPAKDAPRTEEQLEICVDYFYDLGKQKYEVELASVKNKAETEYAALPDSKDKPTLAEYVSLAVTSIPLPETRAEIEAKYAFFVQPEVDTPVPTFAELKHEKLAYLEAAFYTACQRPVVMTAEGWLADANETANRNVQGLITSMENGGAETVQFCDAENQFHAITLGQLKAVQLQIIAKGQQLYAQKWAMRTAIEAADNEAALNAVTISF